ncbi:hypothetical protein OPV22_010378 [Ensete ventricosum]|uniref:Uncharacterized protein n=1 Tax=Ensete ventricosum TaxID=4639 RepID=A0AAV8RKQ4_ENSVE|nr:hypothetical protein OPV22_010378 [Ensete ventricosum]
MGHGLPRRDAVGVCPVVLHATRHVTGVGLQRGFKAVCVPISAKASRAGGQTLPSSLRLIRLRPLLSTLASGSFPLASPASYKVASSCLTHNAVTIVVAASAPINFGIWSAGGVSLSPPAALSSPMGAVRWRRTHCLRLPQLPRLLLVSSLLRTVLGLRSPSAPFPR